MVTLITGVTSIPHSLSALSKGLVKPLMLQRLLVSYYMKQLDLSLHRDMKLAHSSAINDINIDCTENRYLLSGGADGTIAIHDLSDLRDEEFSPGIIKGKTYNLVCTVPLGSRDSRRGSIETVQWFPMDTGIFTSSGTDRLLKIWDANTLRVSDEYSFDSSVNCHHISPIALSHNLIAIGTNSSTVQLVDPRVGSAIHSLRAHKEGAVRAVRWSNNDEYLLATGGGDKFAILWDVRTSKGCLMKLQDRKRKKSGYIPNTTHDGQVNGLHFTGHGNYLATIGTDQTFYMWDVHSGKKRPVKYPPLKHTKRRSIKFDITKGGSENYAFIPTGTSITAFNILAPTSHSKQFNGHYRSVNCCAYHEYGSQLITGANDHKILVWNRSGDKELGEYLYERQAKRTGKSSGSELGRASDQPIPEAIPHFMDSWTDEEDD